MKRLAHWLLFKVCFAALLYSGWILDNAGPRNIVAVVTTMLFIVALLLTFVKGASERGREKPRPVPAAVSNTVEAIFTAFLVWHSAWVVGWLYLIAWVLTAAARESVQPREDRG